MAFHAVFAFFSSSKMVKVFVLALVLLMAEAASFQLQPRVEMEEAVERRDSTAYGIRVECPNQCTEKVR